MKEFDFLENPEFGKEYTPSKWMGDPEYTKITRLKMTCGGGLGGQSWYEYVYRQQIPSNQIVAFTRYDGKEIRINTSYVVEAEDFTLARAVLDISEWCDIQHDNGERVKEYLVLINDGKTLTLR